MGLTRFGAWGLPDEREDLVYDTAKGTSISSVNRDGFDFP